MNLTIDTGNTGTKVALYNGDALLRKDRLKSDDLRLIYDFIGSATIDGAIVSSVSKDPAQILELLSGKISKVHLLTWKSQFPFKIDYKTPRTIGIDRLAAAAGALLHHPGKNLLVIDAGSAVTYDIISGNVYSGGSISPGLQMRFRALHQFTEKLPLVEKREAFSFPGKTTDDAIAGGVVMGLAFETNGYILEYEKKYSSLITVITGGDAEIIKMHTEKKMILHPDLVTDGLNYLLEINKQIT